MVAGTFSSSATTGAPAWDVIVGDRFIAALAAPAPDAVLSALAERASDPSPSIEALVGLIPIGREHAVESFALVWWADDDVTTVTAVVRGEAVVDLDSPGGSRRFDSRGIRPWHLADFRDVVALRLTGSDTPLGPLGVAAHDVEHARASLRASAVEWSSVPRRRSATDVASAVVAPALKPHSFDEFAADTVLRPRPSAIDADTALTPRPAAKPEPIPTPTVPIDVQLDGLRPAVPRAPTAHPVPSRQPADAPSASSASSAPPKETDPVPTGPRFRIAGEPPRTLTGPVLIGRRPLPPPIGRAGAAPELVAVDSPTATVSGTHLELRLEGERLVATDLRSTNGTIVRTARGSRRMRAGESIVVTPGTTLDLGDDTIVEILPAHGAPFPQ
ncbi:FHA domain-containing protein [Agromyces albus]|uniref:FHA domain-containing protein n=1 Tax=Agromyces albus TaxID=205332 RepID=UPI0027D925A4|nr:FHA domain-containing protein [Agromyces albus]